MKRFTFTSFPPRNLFLLAAWGSVAVAELIFVGSDVVRPPPHILWLEFGLIMLIGSVHARIAPRDFRSSSLIPGVAFLSIIIGRTQLLDPFTPLKALATVGVIGMGLLVIWLSGTRFNRTIPAIFLSLGFVLIGRFVVTRDLDLLRPLVERIPITCDSKSPPIVVISVDTLRSDEAVGMQSYQRLAARGIAWPRAMAGGSWTVPSLATLHTGEPVEVNGAGFSDDGFSGIAPNVPVLAEELQKAGYKTAAYVTNVFVGNEDFGFQRGFEIWRYQYSEIVQPLMLLGAPAHSQKKIGADHLVNGALSFLSRASCTGTFLWIHLLDPHLPYTVGTENDQFDESFVRRVRVGRIWTRPIESAKSAYRTQIKYADKEILRLLDALEEYGYFEKGVIVFTSDHGEEFWEHGGFEHGHSHHGEVLDVPLVLVAPGLKARAGQGVASLADVAPTLRAIAGLTARGIDLREPIPSDRVATAAGNLYYAFSRSLREGSTRIIVDQKTARAYDLAADPGEFNPRDLNAVELSALENNIPTTSPVHPTSDLDAQQSAALKKLGYIW